MRVLITGHLGFIGSIITPMLLQGGHEVTGLDVDYYRNCRFGDSLARVPCICKDIRDTILTDFDSFDAVIHLAALSNDALGNLNPSLTMEINYYGTLHVAHLAKRAGVKLFLFSSSCSNYGASGDSWQTEDSNVNPISTYGRSKVLAELSLHRLADRSFCPVSLRCATAYGISPSLRLDIVLNEFAAFAVTKNCIRMKSRGIEWRPLVHVEDIGRAILAVLCSKPDHISGKAINVGQSRENYQVVDIAKLVLELVPGSSLEPASELPADPRSYRVDFSRIQQLLPAYDPKWSAQMGAEELVRTFRSGELRASEIEEMKYVRCQELQRLVSDGRLGCDLRWT